MLISRLVYSLNITKRIYNLVEIKKENNRPKFNLLLNTLNMTSKIPNLGQCSIDSLKLRIELKDLYSFDSSLNENLVTLDEETLSVVEETFKRKSKYYQSGGFGFYASIVENVKVSKDRSSDCLILLINSKQLGSKYFEGITKETVPIIYDEIKRLGIMDCSASTFLYASPTDIDFKKDFSIQFDEYKEVINSCRIMTKQSTNRDKGCTVFAQKDNWGISWSVRTTKNYLSNPYTKIYHKGLEFSKEDCNGGSKAFKDRYLPLIDVSNIMRIETTVKNKKHLESLKIPLGTFTFYDLLSLSDENKDKILAKAINSHLLPRTKSLAFKTKSKMSPTQRIYLNLLMGLINDSNFTFKRALNLALNGIENASTKSLNKKTLTRLYTDHLEGTDYETKSDNVENVLSGLGWF